MTPWLYSIEPSIDGVENMRRDEAMAEACREDGVPRLRLYSWSPWTISLGHNQSDDGVDSDALARAGYGLVRRPTGGRAVFHADELTYAVAMPSSGAGVHETYARISEALRAGLADVGAHVEFERSQPDFRTHYDQEDSESCFSASALNELVWNGRKLVGSAQRRYGPVLLQHGSLLLGDAHLEIIDFLFARADTDRRVAMKRRLASRTTTLREILGGTAPELIDLAMAIVHGFGATFAATFARVDDITLAPNQHESEPSIR
jgi:lipoate-protein ligase A